MERAADTVFATEVWIINDDCKYTLLLPVIDSFLVAGTKSDVYKIRFGHHSIHQQTQERFLSKSARIPLFRLPASGAVH